MCSGWTLSHKEAKGQSKTSSSGGPTSSEQPGVAIKGRQVAPPRPVLGGFEAEFDPGSKELLKWSRWRKWYAARLQLFWQTEGELKRERWGTSLLVQWLSLWLHMQWVQVQSPVWELRSHRACSQKNIKQKQCCDKFNEDFKNGSH